MVFILRFYFLFSNKKIFKKFVQTLRIS